VLQLCWSTIRPAASGPAAGLAAGGEVENLVDESDLTVNVIPCQPSNLPLPL